MNYELRVNNITYPIEAPADRNLLSVIRNEVGLTGTKEGCDDCECGACMVLLDGQPINACSYLAAQAEDREITTIEGLVDADNTSAAGEDRGHGTLHPIQQAILDEGGVQCGFCTPGMIMSTCALLARNPNPTDEDIRIGLSGNLCRCTGYATILAAVQTLRG